MAGISQDWDWTKIPVIIRKSTKRPMSLFDGLAEDFEEYEILEADDESAIGCYREAGEVIPIRPITVDDYFDDNSQPPEQLHFGGHDDSSLVAHNFLAGTSNVPSLVAHSSGDHPSTHAISSSSASSGDHPSIPASSSVPLSSGDQHSILALRSSESGYDDPNDYFIEGDRPQDESEHFVADDGLGGKRSREDVDDSSRKLQKTTAPSPTLMLGFQHSAISSGTYPSAFSGLATYPSFGTISYSCPVMSSSSSLAATALSSASSSSSSVMHEVCMYRCGPIATPSFFNDGPPYSCDPLSDAHWGEIRQAAAHRMSTQLSSSGSFMPQRTGSTLVPPPIADFNKGLGNHFYAPPSVLRLKDDGQDPSQARTIADITVPPMLTAEASWKDVVDLARSYDLHAFNSFVSGTLMRQGFVKEREEMHNTIDDLKSQLNMGNSSSLKVMEDLEKEREISADLRRDKEKLEADYCSLRAELDDVVKGKEDSDKKISQLQDDLRHSEIGLEYKHDELEKIKSSLQGQIDSLRDELDTEKKLKIDLMNSVDELVGKVTDKEAKLLSAIQYRRDTLAAFPDLFTRLLAHPDVKDVFDRFN